VLWSCTLCILLIDSMGATSAAFSSRVYTFWGCMVLRGRYDLGCTLGERRLGGVWDGECEGVRGGRPLHGQELGISARS
jgi:hypothetical protein